ncbi:MAG: hypothetical protein OXF62_02265 [Caldilineaceae bacterium]|nr:hypothetical protein [Caldilineaceae bacterium]
MADRMAMQEKLGNAFAEEQAEVLSEVIFNAYNELVRRADFNELKDVVRDLAEAQSRTEERVGALAEAQGRTEKRVEELAEAQQRTEYAVQQLAQQVGGLSNRMGGDLEDIAADLIHDSLQRELGWQVDGLGRAWQSWDGTEEEIDVFGKVHDPARPDTPLWVVAEVKFNLTMRDFERFALLLERAARHLEGEIVPICFCYRIRPAVRQTALEAGHRIVLSNGRMI